MRNETRQKFNAFTGQLAKLNAITSAMVQFTAPSVSAVGSFSSTKSAITASSWPKPCSPIHSRTGSR